jgi:hypothetical protein
MSDPPIPNVYVQCHSIGFVQKSSAPPIHEAAAGCITDGLRRLTHRERRRRLHGPRTASCQAVWQVACGDV